MTEHRIVFGDSRKMREIADKSVQLIITSPPYWQLKDYGTDNQIGFNDSYEEYINNLNLVWKECDRVLADGCRLCVNIGDQFARSVYYGRYKVIPIRTEIIRCCESLGMDYMGAIIWQKTTTTNTSGGGAIMGSFPYPRNGILKIDYEFILVFKKQGNSPKPTKQQKEKSALSKEEWSKYFSSHWNFNGVRQNEHLAMFPEELPKRLIKMFSFFGETVLDPFAGSGTTSLASMHLGRNSVGYEINRDFESIIREKLCEEKEVLEHRANVVFCEDENCEYSFDGLPYVFKDPLKIDKKIDLKSKQFGSKIDKNVQRTEELFSVKEVLSPEKIVLKDGRIVRLLGIKTKNETSQEAVDFLKKKFRGHKVFLKEDKSQCVNEKNPLCYVYLENKTFINRHLVKSGFVLVDDSMEYKWKNSFSEDVKNG